MRTTKITLLLIVILALLAAFWPADDADAQRTFREQSPIMVTSAGTDTTITFDYPGAMVQVYPFTDNLWISYTPGCSTPVKIPNGKGYTVQAQVTSITLHKSVTATEILVTPVKE